jgi:adenosylcobinamide-phosphate synthase
LAFLLLDVLFAYIIDLIVGDPHWLPHPIRFIGWLINKSERLLRAIIEGFKSFEDKKKAKMERVAGVFLTIFVVSITFIIVFMILKVVGRVNPVLFHILNIYFIYSSIAAKCLAVEADKVYDVLLRNDIEKARVRLSMLVGRQTEGLKQNEIIRGVVETTAENTVDGVLSPLLYAFIGSFFGIGAPLVYAFKAASTLDSMVGYMNEKYINLGRASARFDDLLNYVPARFSGILIPTSAIFCGRSFKKSFSIMKRDRRNHKSPNCAYPEAAVAGALGVRLGGSNVYFGKLVEKPTIGDAVRELNVSDIKDTIKIMYVSSFLTVAFEGFVAALIMLIL